MVHSDKVATQVDCNAICLSDAICQLWLAAGNINKITPNPFALISCVYLNSEVVEQIDEIQRSVAKDTAQRSCSGLDATYTY